MKPTCISQEHRGLESPSTVVMQMSLTIVRLKKIQLDTTINVPVLPVESPLRKRMIIGDASCSQIAAVRPMNSSMDTSKDSIEEDEINLSTSEI